MAINTIYVLRNKCNAKVYVGQTWQTLKARNGTNGSKYNHSLYLYNAIQKYGWDNFYYETLTFCGTQESADYWETYFIDKYDSQNRERGYNLKNGGSRGKCSEETKKKLSKIHKGKPKSLEHNKKVSEANKGRKRTPEQNKRMSELHKGKIISEETKKKMAESQKLRRIREKQ